MAMSPTSLSWRTMDLPAWSWMTISSISRPSSTWAVPSARQLTVGGFITVIPVLILSCFPDKSPIYENGKALTTVIAIIIGLLLACFCQGIAPDGDPLSREQAQGNQDGDLHQGSTLLRQAV